MPNADREGPAGDDPQGMAAPPALWKTVVASSVSIFAGKVVTHPLDTLKAQVQVDTNQAALNKSGAVHDSCSALRRVLRRTTVRSLYQGYGIATLGSLPAGALYMTTYERLRPELEGPRLPGSRLLADFCAGFAAEVISCVFWCPVDVIKERLQVQRDMVGLYSYAGPLDAFQQILRSEGVFGLYRAYGATLVAFGPQTSINLALYERFERWAKDWYFGHEHQQLLLDGRPPPVPPWLAFACASSSGLTACLVTTPLDLAKLRMQVVRASRHAKRQAPGGGAGAAPPAKQPFNYAHIADALHQIARREGPSALFKGALLRCVVWVPQTAIFLATFKTLLARL